MSLRNRISELEKSTVSRDEHRLIVVTWLGDKEMTGAIVDDVHYKRNLGESLEAFEGRLPRSGKYGVTIAFATSDEAAAMAGP